MSNLGEGYKLATYAAAEGPRAGVVLNGTIFPADDLTGNGAYRTMLGILNDWTKAEGRIEVAIAARGAGGSGIPLNEVRLLPPVMYPSVIFCAGANYVDHTAEMARVHNLAPEPDPHSLGLSPWHFIKPPRALTGTNAAVPLPGYSKMVDWEGELAAVIGLAAKNISTKKALDYVAGYTVANDLSARDFTRRPHIAPESPFKYDWVSQKSFDSSCPVGPWIAPAKQVADPQNLRLQLFVNDVVKQDSHTSKMIFTLAEQIAHLSTRITLYPGDMILTGTPAGVGMARNEFLKPGDTVRVTIERVGTLTNTFA